MGIILDTLRKTDPSVQDCTAATINPTAARSHVAKTVGGYGESGHDTAPEIDTLGGMEGDASQQDKDDAQLGVLVDATKFDEKVRQLVESAGAQYNFKTAQAQGLAKRLDPELLGAVQRLQKNAPLLNRVVALTEARKAKRGSPSGSQSGNFGGGTSSDGNAGGAVSKWLGESMEHGLRLMGRR